MSSKDHNPHYLKRYIKFIFACKEFNNKNLDDSIYYEKHHIAPKASDLFPEYENLRVHKWNKVKLTFRQHLIAHVLLWKAYGKSQAIAIDCMLDKFNSNTNTLYGENRKVPEAYYLRYLEKVKLESNKHRATHHIGLSTYKDQFGKHYYLTPDDPLIEEFDLVPFKTGSTHSGESKMMMSETKKKNPHRRITMYFLDYKRKVKLYTKDFDDHLAQGWTLKLTPDDKAYVRTLRDKAAGNKLKGRYNYMYPDGTFYGKIDQADPIIKELRLIPYETEKMKKQRSGSFQRAAVEANSGSTIYNNGVKEKKFKNDPGGEWKLGRLPRTEEHKRKQIDAIRKLCKGTKQWTNGIKNIRLPGDQEPPEGFWRGLTRNNKKP